MNELNNDRNFLGQVKDWINENPGTTAGIIIGLILGIFLFTLGIIKTLLLIIFMLIGYWFGRRKDEDGTIVDQVTKIFKSGDK